MSEKIIQRVALFGARGNLGQFVLPALVAAGFTVTIISNSPSTINSVAPVVHANLDNKEELVNALRGQDAVVVCIARGGAIQAQTTIIDAAVEAGVKLFVPSEFGADTLADSLMNAVPIMQAKRKIIDYLRSVCERSNLEWVGISSGAFLDWGLLTNFLGFNLEQRSAILYSGGDKKFNTSTRASIAAAIVSVLQYKCAVNRYVYIADLATSQQEILEILERLTQVHWSREEMDAFALRKEGEELWNQGQMAAAARPLIIGNLFGSGQGTLVEESLLENHRLGLQKVDLEEEIRKLLSHE